MHSRRVSPLTLDMMRVFHSSPHYRERMDVSWHIRRLSASGRHPISCPLVPEIDLLPSLLVLLPHGMGMSNSSCQDKQAYRVEVQQYGVRSGAPDVWNRGTVR